MHDKNNHNRLYAMNALMFNVSNPLKDPVSVASRAFASFAASLTIHNMHRETAAKQQKPPKRLTS